MSKQEFRLRWRTLRMDGYQCHAKRDEKDNFGGENSPGAIGAQSLAGMANCRKLMVDRDDRPHLLYCWHHHYHNARYDRAEYGTVLSPRTC